jgi:hypothetical protein
MSSETLRYQTLSDGRSILQVDRPGAKPWICELMNEFYATDSKSLRKSYPQRLLAWYACDCAERQFGPSRNGEEVELVVTTTVRRWVASMEPPEACDIPVDETVETTQAAWCAAYTVVVPGEAANFAVAGALEVQRNLDEKLVRLEQRWQWVRLSVLAGIPTDVWSDWVTFQVARDMAEDQLRPWSETFLELVGVPQCVWSDVGPDP